MLYEYDTAYGPPNPRPFCLTRTREWEDPMAWVDLLVDAPGQLARNVAANSTRPLRRISERYWRYR